MPKVPVIESQQIAPEPLGLPGINVQTTPDAQGAAIGRGLSSLGQALFQRGLEMKREDDATKGMEAFTVASDLLRQHEHGNGGSLTRGGKDALGIVDETDDRVSEIFNDVSKGLENDEQKRAFRALWRRRRESSLNSASRHEAQQRQVFKDEITNAIITDSINQASSNFNDPQSIEIAKHTARAAIQANGQGKSRKVLELQELAALTAINKEVIERRLVDDPGSARVHFELSIKEIDPKDVPEIEAALKRADITEKGQQQADIIMDSGKSDREKVDSARAISNPQERDEAVRRVKMRIAGDKTLEQTERKELSEKLQRQLEATFNLGSQSGSQDIKGLLSIIDKAPDASVRRSMNAWLTNRLKGNEPVTDWETFYKLETLSAEKPLEFKKLNLLTFRHALSNEKFSSLVKKQGSIDSSGDVEGRTFLQIMNNELRKIGVETGVRGSKGDQEKTAQFFKFVREEMQFIQQQTGRKPTQDDIQKIIDRGMTEGEIKGGFFSDPDVRFFEAGPDKRFFIDDVPDDDRSQIISALRRAGLPVTDEAIVNWYTISKTRR